MTKTEKQEKLKKLDENVLKLMLKHTGTGGDTNLLTELSVAVNYLKGNAIVEEKAKSSVEEDTKKRLKDAADRRKNNASE